MSGEQVYPSWQNLPGQTSIIEEDGQLTPDWNEFFSNNVDNSVYYFRGDGFLMPFFPGSLISNINTNDRTGRILYDSDNDLFLGNIAGTYQQFVTMTFSALFLIKKENYTVPKMRFHVEHFMEDALFLQIGNKKYKIPMEEVKTT
jgi:hypothetical protein